MSIGKHFTRQLAIQSADGQCAICLNKKSPSSPFLDLQAGHIWPDSEKGPYTFWNLLPICRNCNPSERETRGVGLPYNRARESFYYWTFKKSRYDVALKLALYFLFDRIVLNDVDKNHETQIDRFLFHVIWACRFFGFSRCISHCSEMRKMILTETSAIKDDSQIEMMTTLVDFGKWEDGAKLIEECFDEPLIQKASKSLSWRLAQNPMVPQYLVEKVRNESLFLMAGTDGESEILKDERVFDSLVREYNSDLLRNLIQQNDEKALTVLDELSDVFSQLRSGIGCSSTYQKLCLLLGMSKKVLGGHSCFEKIYYWSRHHACHSPIRAFWLPKEFAGAEPFKQIRSNRFANAVDPSAGFDPVPGSFAETMRKYPALLSEDDFLAVVLHCKSHLCQKCADGQRQNTQPNN